METSREFSLGYMKGYEDALKAAEAIVKKILPLPEDEVKEPEERFYTSHPDGAPMARTASGKPA
jgi:hypothetical protein